MDGAIESKCCIGTGQVYGFVRTHTLHTARNGCVLRLLYPYHPLFGQEIQVFGAAGGLRDMMYVRLPNNTSRGIPAWMFDEAVCAGVRSENQSAIDCGALLRLCGLLDSHSGKERTAVHDSATTTNSGAAVSKRQSPSPSAIEPNVHEPANATGCSAKVRDAHRRDTPVRRSQKPVSKKGSK